MEGICCVCVFGDAIWKAWNDGIGVEAPSEMHVESANIGRFSGVGKPIKKMTNQVWNDVEVQLKKARIDM